jgi:hypothetical protein
MTEETLPLEYAAVAKRDGPEPRRVVAFIRQLLFAIGTWLVVYGLAGLLADQTRISSEYMACLPWGAAIIAFVMPLPKRWIN